jgi:hypothetical protein
MASELNVGSLVVGGGVAGNKLAVHQTDAGLNSYVHITHADTGSAVSDGLSVGLDDTGLNAAIRLREAGTLTLYTSNENRLTIDSAGLATFSNEITCTGINISSQTDSAGRTSGKLDHYEEGTFTASLTAATPPTSVPTATGNYTRIGNLCHFQLKFNNVNTSGAVGAMEITGLPFDSANVNDSDYSPINTIFYNLPYSNSNGIINPNESKIRFYNIVDGGAWNNYNISAGGGVYLWLSGTYKV